MVNKWRVQVVEVIEVIERVVDEGGLFLLDSLIRRMENRVKRAGVIDACRRVGA